LLGLIYPAARSLEVILWFWLGGLLFYYLVLGIGLRYWPVRQVLDTPVEWRSMRKIVRRGWLIYINDLGISGTLYLDRYVVAHILGLSEVGLYTLYWNIANGLHVLVTAAIVQVSAPHLIAAFRSSEEEWRKSLETHLVKIVVTVVPLAALGFAAVIFLMPRLGVPRLGDRPDLFALMLLGISLRLIADMLNYGLYSRNLDHQLAWINIAGLALAITMNFVLLSSFGLIGAGISMIITPVALGTARLLTLRHAGVTLPFAKAGVGIPKRGRA
jgi:O-antigen/teichoic acid export membrane protein